MSDWDFTGRTVAITGATGGIAGALIDAMADDGVCLILHARSEAKLREIADAARGRGADVEVVVGDLEGEAKRIARDIAAAGEVDVLINNAGLYEAGDILEIGLDTVRRDLEVNALAAMATIQTVLPGMNARGSGRIVSVSSGGGSFSEGLSPAYAAYAISKAAMNAVTFLAAKAARGDVKANAMCPGWVRTRMGGSGASRSPQEGADTALWLASLSQSGPNGGFFRDREPIEW